jgi:16S rRNA (guanine527-N7)-methyltransferase
VKHHLSLEQVLRFAVMQGMEFDEKARNLLGEFAELILSWSGRQSLISRGDRRHIYERHFLSSLLFVDRLQKVATARLIDIGSGSGFPAVIIKILRPELQMTVIDSSRKKCLFLIEVDEALDLGLQIVHERMEIFAHRNKNSFDIATSRAVADLSDLWNWIKPVLKSKGKLLVLKGGKIDTQIPAMESSGIKTEVYSPAVAWTKFSPYLNEKFLIELEK